MRKRFKRILSALACLVLLTGCGSAGEETQQGEIIPFTTELSGKILQSSAAADDVFSVNYDPDGDFNPIRADNGTNMLLTSLMYDCVFNVDSDFSFYSNVVTNYTTEDNIWWEFTVDTTIPFTDGSTLTAQDVAYSITRAQQSSQYKGRLSAIYGCSALSEDRFAITAATAHSRLPVILNIPIIKYGTMGEDVPPGTGPYRLADSRDKLVLFERNPRSREMPVEEIYLKSYADVAERISAFEASLLDVTPNDPTGIYSFGYGGSNETRTFDTTNLHYLGFNMSSDFFQNSLARYAMNYVVDRDGVAELMNGCGVASALPLLPSSELYNAEYAAKFRFDLIKCAQFFEAAGIKDLDEDGVPEFLVTGIPVEINLSFIVNNNNAVKLQTARRITENLNAIGIHTTLHEMAWTDYFYCLYNGEYDMYYGEMRLTPDWNLTPLFSQNSEVNYARCRDENYAQYFADYLAAGDDTRYDAYQQACQYVIENGGIVPICFERQQMITHRGVVSGASPTQYSLFNRFNEWTIDLTY